MGRLFRAIILIQILAHTSLQSQKMKCISLHDFISFVTCYQSKAWVGRQGFDSHSRRSHHTFAFTVHGVTKIAYYAGKYLYDGGNVYEGEWRNGKKDGRGIFSSDLYIAVPRELIILDRYL